MTSAHPKQPSASTRRERTPADALRGKRLELGLSQHQLSNQTGISIPTISLYERGTRISRRSAIRLAAALGIPVEELSK